MKNQQIIHCVFIILFCFIANGCQKKNPKEAVVTRSATTLQFRLFGDLDKVIHQPIRTKIMAYLVAHGSCDFSTIKELFSLNDGHMTTHMRELLRSGYVEAEKTYEDNRPKTIYHVTKDGGCAYDRYVQQIRNVLRIS